jgi:hypothetical protein
MAYSNIISPQYSFVNFNTITTSDCCDGNNQECLPFANVFDLVFQFSIKCDTITEANDLMLTQDIDSILNLIDGPTGTLLYDYTTNDLLFFEKYRTDTTTVTYIWRNPLYQILYDMVHFDDTFSLQVVIKVNGIIVAALSNLFKAISDQCYTSLIEYTNDQDYAGFNYCNITNPINRARLWMYLSQPKPVEDKAIYRKSNGVIKQTRSLITKEFICLTEHLTENLHDKIVVALGHQTVICNSNNYSGGISKNGDYAIEWVDNYCKAPATFKALATPLAIKNNNCGDCKIVPYSCVEIQDYTATSNLNCNTEIEDIGIMIDQSSAVAIYTATWTNINIPTTQLPLIGISTNNGLSFQSPHFVHSLTPTSVVYDLNNNNLEDHFLQITPTCEDGVELGLANFFFYSGEYAPNPQIFDITTNSFKISTGMNSGVTYDISLNGGLWYIIDNISLSSYTVTGLSSGTTYIVVIKMHGTQGINQILQSQTITTL